MSPPTTGSSTLGLACAGGVIEGALYEIGALCALDEAIEGRRLHDLDIYVGVSSGSLIGSMLASNVSARELSRAVVSESHDPSLNLEPEVLFRPAVGEYAGRLRRLPGAFFSSLRHYLLSPGTTMSPSHRPSRRPPHFRACTPRSRSTASTTLTGWRAAPCTRAWGSMPARISSSASIPSCRSTSS